jgi:phenylacetate-CoA ligase
MGDDPDRMVLPVNTPLDEQIDFIQHHARHSGAVAITTLPTNAELLAQEVLDRGLDMTFIRRFGTYAETLQDHHKDLIRRAFPNARIWETYSSHEFGLIAMICPYEEGYYHLMAHRLGVEVLRDDGSPAPDGEPGQVYVTDYFNRWSPFIRYELGDLAVRGVCPCGKIKLPALSNVLGRVSGTLRHRDGRRILFVDLSVALRRIPGVRQYKVVQDGIEDFAVRLNANHNVDGEVRRAFEAHMGYVPENLNMEYVEFIPRDPNGKFRTSVCNV